MSRRSSAARQAKQVRGVDLSKVDLNALNRYLKKADIGVNAKMSLEDRVVAVADREIELFRLERETLEKAGKPFEDDEGVSLIFGDCGNCGGGSRLSLDECPYCGTSDSQPAPGSLANAEPSRNSPVETSEDVEVVGGQKLVRVPKDGVKQLDQSVRRINGLKADSMVSIWKLGRELLDCYTKQLYKYRVDKRGVPIYEHWTKFCTAELKMSVQYTRDLMAIAAEFKEKDIRELGTEKLKIVLRAPPELRANLLEKASETSKRELAKLIPAGSVRPALPGVVRTEKQEQAQALAAQARSESARRRRSEVDDSVPPPDSGAPTSSPPVPEPKRVVKGDEVTAVIALNRIEIPLFARPMKEGDAPTRAFFLEDDPHGHEELTNGIRCLYRVVRTEGEGLVLVVERRRVAGGVT